MAKALASLALALALPALAGADFDLRKRERLAAQREHRRAVERFYEACLRARSRECLMKSRKFSEERLAALRQSGHNTPVFANY